MPRKPSTYDAGLGLRQARPCRAPVDRRNSGSCGQRRLWSSAFRPDWRRVSDASVLRRWLAHAPPPETAPARWRMLVLRPSVDQLRGRRRRRQGDANDAGSERPVGSPPDDEVPASASASCLPPLPGQLCPLDDHASATTGHRPCCDAHRYPRPQSTIKQPGAEGLSSAERRSVWRTRVAVTGCLQDTEDERIAALRRQFAKASRPTADQRWLRSHASRLIRRRSSVRCWRAGVGTICRRLSGGSSKPRSSCSRPSRLSRSSCG